MTQLHPPATTTGARATTTPSTSPTRRPSAGRRIAVAVTGFLACFTPVVWTVNLSRMVLTGELAEHRFHQLTGQGLLLTTLWLAALLPLVRAGWRGERPPTSAGLLHLTFVGVGLACALIAPQGGAMILLPGIAITGALVWLAIPLRPRLGSVDVAPASLAAALLLCAAVAPYAVDQITLQHAATGHHADNPHYFDMAWLLLTCSGLAVLGALVAGTRRLLAWSGVPVVLTAIAMLTLDQPVGTGLLLLGAGTFVLASAEVPAFAGQRARA